MRTHFIYPTIPGFEQAGGAAGPKFDFNEHPEGNMAVAEKYIKEAGYPSGKYTGGKTITIVGAKGNPAEQDAEIVNQTLKNLGFTTKFTLVETSTMYAKYCNVPKEEIDVCPSVGWIADFADPQTVLNITFNGKFINATGNVNWSQAQQPENQRNDGQGRTGRRQSRARQRLGQDRRRNRRRQPPRFRSTGTSRRTSRAARWTASATSGTSASGTTTTPP